MLYLVKRSLSPKVFRKICYRISLDLHGCGTPGKTGCSGWIDAHRVIYKIGGKRGVLDLGIFQISGQLMNDCADHLQMPQFFRTYKLVKMEPEPKNARIARVPALYRAENPNAPIPGYLCSMNIEQEGTRRKGKPQWQMDVCVAVPDDRTFRKGGSAR